MTIMDDTYVPPCANEPEAFLDERLQSPPTRTDMSRAEWERLTQQRADVHRYCAGCPYLVDCLYRAVVEVDVFGYAACTTEADRRQIRRKLGIEIIKPTAGRFASPRTGAGPIDHETVLALRQAHPNDTCIQLAQRLGCSTSTVKRHLRRARQAQSGMSPQESRTPTVEEVLDCFDELESSRVA
ncbi:MAG: WhiB family transcriptional regulator [Aeromicrobium sp.]